MRIRSTVTGALVAITLAVTCPQASPLTITVISKGGKPLKSCADVQWVRAGGPPEPGGISPGMMLQPLDRLVCSNAEISVELADTLRIVRLSGRFYALVLTQKDGSLWIRLSSGKAVVTSDGPSSLSNSVTSMGALHTSYGMAIEGPGDSAFATTCFVLDGDVRCNRGDRVRDVAAGFQLLVHPQAGWDSLPIPNRDLESHATWFAELDVAKASSLGDAETARVLEDSLRAQYLATFSRPGDGDARLRLGVTQAALHLPQQALYQLKRAEADIPADDSARLAAIAGARSVVYRSIGRFDLATTEYDRSTRLQGGTPPRPIAVGAGVTIGPARLVAGTTPDSYFRQQLELGHVAEVAAGLKYRAARGQADSAELVDLAAVMDGLGHRYAAAVAASTALHRDSLETSLNPTTLKQAAAIVKKVTEFQRASIRSMIK